MMEECLRASNVPDLYNDVFIGLHSAPCIGLREASITFHL